MPFEMKILVKYGIQGTVPGCYKYRKSIGNVVQETKSVSFYKWLVFN
ncbi:hypothetical protein Cpin_2229 [Chitinophaga pinensis DSM 2588]|uniref:Uncharacterized protein n=1 Tax=Chitinophaga pinensis (strain ATCC 43595 / DSM 2588 / LMG 13176 / NBRC 15968 / NCIMB 11800 / UQM 2034) TaxID=485918 RepID=A0A979GV74_CHIPD|nr:hypothetical protein Cpin_2229 [Chitinophaga pinensis DSM 2588]